MNRSTYYILKYLYRSSLKMIGEQREAATFRTRIREPPTRPFSPVHRLDHRAEVILNYQNDMYP